MAAFCHGFVTLPADFEALFANDYPGLEWGRTQKEYKKPVSHMQPFRAILKDFIADDPPFTHMLVKKMLRHLVSMREMKLHQVYPMDVAGRNYKKGLLLDFSIAITEGPFYLFNIRDADEVRLLKTQDLVDFDQMVEDDGVKTWVRALPDPKTRQGLRLREHQIDYKIPGAPPAQRRKRRRK